MNDAGETASDFCCPQCGQGVSFTQCEVAQLLVCPHCGNEFIAPSSDGSTELPAADSEPVRVAQDELDAIRIRQVSMGRRATYRARSYAFIAASACAVLGIQLIWMIIRQVRASGWGLQCTGYTLFAVLAAYGLIYLCSRVRQLNREAGASALMEPTIDPDFSTLDDGSKQVTNLEDVR